jgi:hypothetical protein
VAEKVQTGDQRDRRGRGTGREAGDKAGISTESPGMEGRGGNIRLTE